jgi:hypothetical protein
VDSEQPVSPTPVAQFLAGIHGALRTQRIDEQKILDALKACLSELDNQSLFDDENYTKTHLYHWVVKTCDTACQSISATLRFADKISNNFLKKLSIEVDTREQLGIEFWSQKCIQEASDLEELREELISCRQDVQERVSTHQLPRDFQMLI